MTSNRWDTRAHLDDDPRRVSPTGVPYGAWHDSTMAIEGPAAAAIAELCRERWRAAGGKALEPVVDAHDCWPDSLAPHFRDVAVAISRTRPSTEGPPVYEIEQAFLNAIRSARRSIYAESQYFASRRIAEAIAERLTEPDPPEIVIVNAESAHGWLEPIAMDTARARLVQFVRRADHAGRFRLYCPVTSGGRPIYVHAKLMIVDDRILHTGSANMNNRSLRLDTECDLTIDARVPGNASAASTIARLRDDLLAEHLGVTTAEVSEAVAREGSLIAAVEALRGAGRSLRELAFQPLNGIEKWLADNTLLDPEGAEEMFKPLSQRRNLVGRLRRLVRLRERLRLRGRFHLPHRRRRKARPAANGTPPPTQLPVE
jgi:phosphatidylserine/phosphatidylglycerophosphate/cardiolipin synthase-like enzyme